MIHEMMRVAQRGDTSIAPENTLAACENAIIGGANAIQIDVRTCKSGEPIVIHDHSVNRTTNGQGDISQLNMEQVRALTISSKYKVPTLAEVLNLVDHRIPVFIELKNVAAAKPVAKLIKHYVDTRVWEYSRMPVISSLHQSIVLARESAPILHTGAIMKKLPESLAAVGEYTQSRYILPELDLLSDELMNDARKRGLKVITWNCENKAEFEKAKTFKVDGVISNRYDEI